MTLGVEFWKGVQLLTSASFIVLSSVYISGSLVVSSVDHLNTNRTINYETQVCRTINHLFYRNVKLH